MTQGIVNLSKLDITRADIFTAVLHRAFNGFAALAPIYNRNITMTAHLSSPLKLVILKADLVSKDKISFLVKNTAKYSLSVHWLIPTRYLNLSVKARA